MTKRARILTLSFIVFLLWAVIATATTVYYHQEYDSADQKYNEYYQKYTSLRGSIIQVSVTIDYGNGTSTTKDAVYLSLNTTVFDALNSVAEVNATYYPLYQSFFIESINGVVNNANNNNRYWVFSVNGEHAPISADKYGLHDGDQMEWIYEQY